MDRATNLSRLEVRLLTRGPTLQLTETVTRLFQAPVLMVDSCSPGLFQRLPRHLTT